MMGDKRPYSHCFVGCCFYDLFRTAYSMLMKFPSIFFSRCFTHTLVLTWLQLAKLSSTFRIFIIKGFRTIVFIFIVIVISTTFWLICPPAFLRCLSNSGTFTELRSTYFIVSTNSPKTLNDKNQASSQKFRQLTFRMLQFHFPSIYFYYI